MWDWERASVPYRPIFRRRLLRRRVLTLLAAALIAIPYYLYHQHQVSEPVGARVFDQVVSTISLRYFDRSYHGVAWRELAQQYRPFVINAPTTDARYAALRALISRLHDSHTAVYSPDDLQPPRRESRYAVLGMSPDFAASGPSIDWRRLAPGVGYLRIASFPDSLTDVLSWAMSDLGHERALILDLRGDPGGLVDSVDEVAGMFLPPGTLISSGTRRYHFFSPQQFRATDDAGVSYRGRLIVLIDQHSESGAESLARALQYYHRATLVGTRTAGKVLGVDVEIPLEDGGLLRVATLDMRDPSGQRLEGRGVTPDVMADSQQQIAEAVELADQSQSSAQGTTQWICPISVGRFWLAAQDPTRGYAHFAVAFVNTGGGTYDITLNVTGAETGQPSAVRVSNVSPDTPAFTFVYPSHDPVGVTIERVVNLKNDTVLACTPEQNKEGGDQPDPSSVVTVDDGPKTFPSEITAVPFEGFRAIENSDFVVKAALHYPESASSQGISGVTVVVVTIGAGGKLLDAQVWKSAGSSILDDAALRAARESTFTEPTLNGKPTTANYLIDYVFQASH